MESGLLKTIYCHVSISFFIKKSAYLKIVNHNHIKKYKMRKFNLLSFATFFVAILLVSCNNQGSKKETQVDSTKSQTVVSESTPDYSGTYSLTDKSICDISIEILKKEANFSYVSGKTKGAVEIIKQDADVYLKFIAINGKSPNGDVEAKYENETLLIQNEGNSINPYSIFKKCDAKYLELKKEK